MKQSDNIFEILAFDYAKNYHTQDSITEVEDLNKPIKTSFFSSKPLDPVLDRLREEYNECTKTWFGDTDFDGWIKYVKQFSAFLRTAEKCFLFRNESAPDDTKQYIVYSEYDTSENSEVLFIRDNVDKVRIRVVFRTKPLVEIDATINHDDTYNSLLDYVNNGRVSSNIEFVNINIIRDFGKQVCNEFNFVNIDEILKDESDKVLLHTIRSIISDAIHITFKNIFDSNIISF